jgi:hypothetical protein
MKNAVVAEAEYRTTIANALRATPMITDNACAMGIAYKTLKVRSSKYVKFP